MKIVLFVAMALVAIVVAMAVIGLFLPRDHVASRSRRFSVSRERVWSAIRDVARYPTWRSDVKSVDVITDPNDSAQFREHGAHRAVLFAIDVDEAPSKFVTRIADDSLPYGGTWTYELASADGGTELTITERGFVKNPILRLLSRTVFSTSATMERYLAALAVELERPPSAR